MNQKEAVYKAVTSVKGATSFEGPVTLSREERENVSKLVAGYFERGEASFSEGKREGKDLTTYVSGLISNWLRKDERLNGDTKYTPKNPGSRAGNGDDSLKAMKMLLAVTTDAKAKADIQKAIDERISALRPKKNIDVNVLPEHLRQYVPH